MVVVVCTYAEFLQTDSYLFDALQFFPVCCLDALFCLPLVSESVQPIMSAFFSFNFLGVGVHGSRLQMQLCYSHISVPAKEDVVSLVV